MMSPAADQQDEVEKIAGGASTFATDLERQQETSLPPSFDDPTADGRTATSSEPQSSLDKMHEQSAAILDHEVAHDEAIVRPGAEPLSACSGAYGCSLYRPDHCFAPTCYAR